MSRRFWGFTLASLLFVLLMSGCPPRQNRQVAGREETYTQGGQALVTITFTDNGITVNPAQIPEGDINLRMVNNSSRDQTISIRGRTYTLRRGQTYNTTVRRSAPGRYQVQPAGARTSSVNVRLTEYRIEMNPATIPAGNVVFNVRNTGNAVHAFAIAGQGIEQSTRRLNTGQSQMLRVNNLRPGRYTVYCPVGNHAERGMRTNFTVTEAMGR